MSEYSFESKSALFSTGDGDCLFNSVSVLLVGDESMSLELRYRCCIEMVTNKSKIMLNRMYTKLEPLSPEYDEDCLNCAQPGRWSSAWMLIGLSNLLNLPIKSVYPAVDSTTSRGFKVLNHLFKPPFSDPEKGSLTIKFIEILYGIVSGEEIERERAIRDTGNFKFAPTFQHHYVDIDNWTDITQEQLIKKLKSFVQTRESPNQTL